MVYVLGVNPGFFKSFHDSSACLIKDGRIVAFAEQERFDRIKHSNRFPKDAIRFCLRQAGIYPEDVDFISIGWNSKEFISSTFSSIGIHMLNLDNFYNRMLNYFLYHSNQNVIKILKHMFGKKDIFEIPHHLAHAASTFHVSGFKKSNILTIDGRGEFDSTVFFTGENNEIKKQWHKNFFDNHSFGLIYSLATKNLGLGKFGEGKTMGLAPWGKPTIDFSDVMRCDGSYHSVLADYSKVRFIFSAFHRKKNEKLQKKHKDLAASLQNALENTVLGLVEDIYKTTGNRTLCLAGGVALNCKMNGLIIQQDFVDDIYIQPAASDSGCALGAAMETYIILGYKSRFKMEHAYWGPEFSNEQIEEELKKNDFEYEYHDDIAGIVAELLAKNKIVGWFQGRMEVGPRALGNRSILANPTVEEMKDMVNDVKRREHWRPLAPSMLEESIEEYLENPYPSPFMILAFPVKEEKIREVPAIVHVDGSTRPQTVNKKTNSLYYELIKKFEELSSVPIVLNTSFNDRGDPIVCTPQEALETLSKTTLNYLAIGNFLVKK